MTIDDIKALIAADESRTLELKKTTGELKDGMHSACAFLNTDGGWLIFGIAPKSLKILGQEVTDSTQQEIAKAITGLEPAADVKIHYVDVPDHPGNKVIAMHFDGWVWGERPHTFHGCPYYKVESTTKVMPHESYPYNLKIAEALYKSTYLESWGSGAKRIMDACREQGVEEPTWNWDGGFVIVTFKRPRRPDNNENTAIKESLGKATAQASANDRSTSAQVPLNFRPSTVQIQQLIISMNDDYMTMSELMESMGFSHRTSFRENYFKPALEDGAVELLYPDTPNHPQQKYCLTEAAKEWRNKRTQRKVSEK